MPAKSAIRLKMRKNIDTSRQEKYCAKRKSRDALLSAQYEGIHGAKIMNDTPDNLKKRIADAKAREEGKRRSADEGRSQIIPDGARAGLRAATDLVAGVAVGAFLGYLLDDWLNTKPLFMIVMFFLGFIAGFVNIYRWQTGQEYNIGYKPGQKPGEKAKTDKDEKNGTD